MADCALSPPSASGFYVPPAQSGARRPEGFRQGVYPRRRERPRSAARSRPGSALRLRYEQTPHRSRALNPTASWHRVSASFRRCARLFRARVTMRPAGSSPSQPLIRAARPSAQCRPAPPRLHVIFSTLLSQMCQQCIQALLQPGHLFLQRLHARRQAFIVRGGIGFDRDG